MSRTPAKFTQADIARATSEGKTFIYFLRAGEFVKIGHSTRWKNRMGTMQIGSPYTIVPLLVLVGEPEMERKLHVRFRNDHFRGEWFHLGPAIRQFIKDNLKDCVAKSADSDLRPRAASWDDDEREIIL